MGALDKNIVIIVLQYSVVVKGMEKKLGEEGYCVTTMTSDFSKIRDVADMTDLFILYLPTNVPEDRQSRESLKFVCDKIHTLKKKMILIGEAKNRGDMIVMIPLLASYDWISRPIENEKLLYNVDCVLGGKEAVKKKKKILIVDDDPSYAKIIREWIKDHYEVDIVTAGMQAITFLLKNRADLILLDYEMPICDGPMVLQMLRQEPSLAGIPIVFLTGVASAESVQRVMSLKPKGYVLKSTTREKLLAYLEDLLKE